MKASEILKERGWCQGEYENDKGNVCLARSISLGYNSPIGWLEVTGRLLRKIRIQRFSGLCEWNDVPGRTVEEVIELLESVGQ